MYTGVLQKDCTEEQIFAAKKTVQVINDTPKRCPDCGEVHPDITFNLFEFEMEAEADESSDKTKRAG